MQNPWLIYADSRSRSQLKIIWFTLEFHDHSISPLPLEGFSSNFGQMISVRPCSEPMTHLCILKVKVTVKGHRINPWISCLLHISFTCIRIFIKLWSNDLSETVCRTHDSREFMWFTLKFWVHLGDPHIFYFNLVRYTYKYIQVTECERIRMKAGSLCYSSPIDTFSHSTCAPHTLITIFFCQIWYVTQVSYTYKI